MLAIWHNEGHVLPALGARTVHRARLGARGRRLRSRLPGKLEGAQADDAVGRALPLFEAPLAGKVLTLGHELAILAYIERKCPAVAGADEREWAVSQQFVHQAEDVYKALVAKQPTLYETDKVSKEALAEWWAGDDRALQPQARAPGTFDAAGSRASTASNLYGRSGSHTGRFPRRRPTLGKAGFLTLDGKSVGECKLFATLHMLVMIKNDVLAPFPALTAFYERWRGEATKRGRRLRRPLSGPLKLETPLCVSMRNVN